MKTLKSILVVTIILLGSLTTYCQTNLNDFPVLKGPYLGQKTPGITPEIFAPDIVSRSNYFEHSAAIFSPDGNEVYWSAKANDQRNYKIYFMKIIDGIWSKPKIASFCLENDTYQQFTLSPDGKKLYFTNGSNWRYVEKKDGSWSSPIQIPPRIKSEGDINICSVTNSGSIYFIKRPEFNVYVSNYINNTYSIPEKLSTNINSIETRENSVYVAPDESYMIIEATKDAATCELFITYKMKNNSWSERKKLPIKWGRLPCVSPDGKYLFFMTREGIYWVSAKIIENL